jgi:HTH-type transcriptional regulator/antitoxin HigA
MSAQLDAAITHLVDVAPLLTAPSNDAHYLSLVESLDALLDTGGADESHPLAGLAGMVGNLVSGRDQHRYPMPAEMTGLEALCFFLERDCSRQKDLPESGNQAKVSEIMAGHRELNLRQSRELAVRFGVPVGRFAAEGAPLTCRL